MVVDDSLHDDLQGQSPINDVVRVLSWWTVARAVGATALACAAVGWGVTALYVQDPCSLAENGPCEGWSDLQQICVTGGSLLGFLGLVGLAGSLAPGRSRPRLLRASTRAVVGAVLLVVLLVLDRRVF